MKNVEDLYALTPVQQGMLLHSLADAEAGTYVNQLSCDLAGELDAAAFKQAWESLVERHAILRTAFVWEGVKQLLQVVRKKVELPWREEDWRDLPKVEQQDRLAAFLDEDRRRGFHPARAPLMRITLIRLRDDVHRLVWTHSHMLLDGWSLALVMREVFLRYEAARQGASLDDPQGKQPGYGDYIAWLKRRDPATAEAFWQRLLTGFEEPTQISLPGATKSQSGHHELRIHLSASQTEALETLAKRSRLTLNILLTAAWTLVLSRASQSEDVVFGVTVSGRPAELAGAEEMVGLFINTLPLRLQASPRAAVRPWLESIQELQVELRQYEHSSLVAVQRFSGVPQGTPLFECLYVFENYPMLDEANDEASDEDSALAVENVLAIESTNYPLNMLAEPGERLSLRSIYATDRFDSTTVLRLLGHMRTVLIDLAIRGGEGRLGEVAWLSKAERFQILQEWNDTARVYDLERTLPQLFDAQAAKRGSAVAVVSGDEYLSYQALDRRSRVLAQHLRGHGIGRGDLVAIYLERGLEMVPAVLAVLRLGAAYVPLETSQPSPRLAFILASLGIRVALTQTPLLRALSDQHLEHRICVNAPLGSEDGLLISDEASPEDRAYIIFTSGSTGEPKGVVGYHRAVVNLIEWLRQDFGFSAEDRALFVASLGFDLSVFDIFGLLACGGSLRVASEGELRDPERLVRLLLRGDVTFWDSAPAALQQLLPFLPVASETQTSRLRQVFLSGDWIPLSIPDRLRASFPNAEVTALGGATEATVWSNFHRVGEIAPHWSSIPYGRPMPNGRYLILDAELAPCPIGVPGDLYIGGDCLVRGYSRARLSAERFLPDPTSTDPGERLYTTGDRARLLPNGELEFLGRLDNQVKIRGFRIELGEIEKALARHPDLRDVVVLARPASADGRDKRLVAYVVPCSSEASTSETTSVASLRAHLQGLLPEYMIPSAFVTLSALPVTANGKLDRRQLPAPEDAMARASSAFLAPRDEVEEQLATLWAEKLGLERVGVEDNFFELGGHSLLAVEIVGRLRRALAPDLAITSLFDEPTVAGLAGVIKARRDQPATLAEEALPEIVPAPEEIHEPFPLTDLQEAYWLGATGGFELGTSPHIYSENQIDRLDLPRLERAIDLLVARHPMLRAIVTEEGQQRILESVPGYKIAVLDLTGETSTEAEARVLDVRRKMINQGPQVQQWPLFEVRAVTLDERQTRLHASFSLLIADALSTKILFAELLQLYSDPQVALEPLDLHYRDYVQAMHGLREGDLYRRAEAYWQRRLDELPPAMELPLAKDPSQLTGHHLVRRRGFLAREKWERIKTRASELGITPTVILCAAYAQVLATWSKIPRFTLNVLFLHRLPLHPQVTKIVGNCTSTILLEVDASPARPFAERAKKLQKQLWEDLENIHFTGVQVLRELNRRRGSASRATMPVVFTSALNLNAPSADSLPELPGPSLESKPIYNSVQTPQVWIDHQTGEPGGGVLGFNWDTVDELFPEGFTEELFATYESCLEWLAAEENDWLSTPQLTPKTDLELWRQVNAEAARFPVPSREARLHVLALESAKKRPDAPAVFAFSDALTHGELAALSQEWSRRLRQLGARPNRLVAVVMEKGWQQVAAVLAVQRAGAAYLPIDPSLPAWRVRYLLENGEVEIALTQARVDASSWPEGVERLVVGEQDLQRVRQNPPRLSRPETHQSPEDLAYVIFTSGSTGQPKGVMIDHRGAANTIFDVNQRFAVGPEDRVLALSALSFDLSVYDVFGLLAAGGSLVLPEPEAAREPSRWLALCQEHQVTIWNSVPALMEMLVDHLEGTGERLPASLRLVLLSGDWIPVTLPDRLRALGGEGLRVISLGGATEASIWSILYEIDGVSSEWTSIPYGRPMAHQSFYVLDEALRPRPALATGELYISGIGLARGYWRDEEKTNAQFVVDPNTGQRLYRTGDLGRYLEDGTIEFLGREDSQVKIQGYRIELGEVETSLLQHADVRAAAVVARAPGLDPRALRLVAYVVLDGTQEQLADLRAWLGDRLPPYMVPTAWVVLDALPLSANGKVDRKALPAPEQEQPKGKTDAPASPLEDELISIWELVLERENIGPRDSFFELGGHSLAAVRLMNRIRQRFEVDLPLSVLLDGATVENVAAQISAGTSQRQALVKMAEGGPEAPIFCVHPVGGQVLCYRQLAALLGVDRPFFGLQTPNLDGEPSLEELAARYVEEVRAAHPTGPCLLAGWSMGGVLAFEMARQLVALGREVAFVGVIDAKAPSREANEPKEEDLQAWFRRDVAALTGEDPSEATRDLDSTYAIFRANARALATYRPQPWEGSIVLLLATEEVAGEGESERVAEAWRRLARGGVEACVLPGNHYTLLQPPQVLRLADQLQANLTAPLAQER